MQESSNAIQFLEELREENGKKVWRYSSLAKFLDRKARENGIPLTGQFELTPLCNFNCKMCYVHLDNVHMAGQELLSVEQWKILMRQAWEAGMVHVTLSGGECLAYPGFKELYLFLQSMGCDITVLTNAYLLEDKWLEFFQIHKPALIQVTLYGWNDDVYERVTGVRGFTTVEKNVRKAIEIGFNVRLVITPNTYLGEDVLETIRVARSITSKVKINSAIVAPREETGRSGQRDDPDIDLYIRIYRLMNELNGIKLRKIDPNRLPAIGGPYHECDQCGLSCGGGRSGFVTDWKGNVMPCYSLDVIHAASVPNGFREAWNKIHQEVLNWPCVPECQGCAYSSICHRCAGIMLQYTQPGKQPISMCQMIKRLVSDGVSSIPECE